MEQWISTKERLPDVGVRVLLYHGEDRKEHSVAQLTADHEWLMWEGPFGDTVSANRVTHWMPLPEPPSQ